MTASGLGIDGYQRYQKEVIYGTSIVSSMIDLPVKDSSLIKAMVENIENQNLVSSRLKQVPNAGRIIVNGEISMDLNPTTIGDLLEIFLGGATTSGPSDTSAYTHYWLSPDSGERIAESMTFQQAIGADTAVTFDGVKIVGMSLSGEVGGNVSITFEVVGQGYTEDVARVSSWSYPTAIPFSFITCGLSEATVGAVSMNSFSVSIDLGYEKERFKLGSAELVNPVFTAIPTCTFSCNIDADEQWVEKARDHTALDLTLTLTHPTTVPSAASTKYTFILELPGCRLSPETAIENSSERLSMDLEFEAGYGGATTNGTDKMFEIRVIDGNTTHT
jgi:hypothetical protein